MASQWYYSKGDQSFGPVSSKELRRLASSGGLDPNDLVWKKGMADWKPAGKAKGLFDQAFEEIDPPVPPLQSELGNQNEITNQSDLSHTAKDFFASIVSETKNLGKKIQSKVRQTQTHLEELSNLESSKDDKLEVEDAKFSALDIKTTNGTRKKKPLSKTRKATIFMCTTFFLMCFICCGTLAWNVPWPTAPEVEIKNGHGVVEIDLWSHDSPETDAYKIAETVYELASQHEELISLDVRVKLKSIEGFVDEYGNSVKGNLDMGTILILESWVSELRKFKDKYAYKRKYAPMFKVELQRLNYGWLLGDE